MAVNLIEQFGRSRTREVLETSFAQFQADRAVVDLARKVRTPAAVARRLRAVDGVPPRRLRRVLDAPRELADLEKQGASRAESAEPGRARPPPADASPTSARELRQHPCHACPEREQHARWAERWYKLKKQTDQLSAQIRSRTGAVAKIFDRVTDVLLDLGYLVPRDGSTRRAGDRDSSSVSRHRRGRRRHRRAAPSAASTANATCSSPSASAAALWNMLDAPSLAAMAATLVYEPRRDEGTSSRAVPAPGRVPRRPRPHAGRSGPSSTTSSRRTGCPAATRRRPVSPSPCTAGPAAPTSTRSSTTPTSPPATSCAGRSRRSTSSTSSRSSPTSRSARRRRQALDAVRRGIVAVHRGRDSTESSPEAVTASRRAPPPSAGHLESRGAPRLADFRLPLWLAVVVALGAGPVLDAGFPDRGVWPADVRRHRARPRSRCGVAASAASFLVGLVGGLSFYLVHIAVDDRSTSARVPVGRPVDARGALLRRRGRAHHAGLPLGPARLARRPSAALVLLPVVVAGLWTRREFVAGNWPYGGFAWGRMALSQSREPVRRRWSPGSASPG